MPARVKSPTNNDPNETTPGNAPRRAPQSNANDPIPQLLLKAGARDRANIEKQLAAVDADASPDRAIIWRRLFAKLGSLVSLPPVTAGMRVVQFYRPDGQYRMQVFALEDADNGLLYLYLPDVLAKAVEAKLLVPATSETGEAGYEIVGKKKPFVVMPVVQVDDKSMSNLPQFVKNMTGWHRKAVRVALDASATADDARVTMTLALCDLAADQWPAPDPAAVVTAKVPANRGA